MHQPRDSVFADAMPEEGGVRGRDSLFLMATLQVADGRPAMQVRVRNLSSGGLMAELPEPIAPDVAIEVDVRGLGRIPGRIAWQTEGRAGIAFDKPVDPQRARKPVSPAKDDGKVRPLRPLF